MTSFCKGKVSPLPATVVIMPVFAATFRTRLLPVSAIKMFPDLSTATSSGKFSSAVVASTLSDTYPLPLVPAIVVMMPLMADTFRILLLAVSVMKTLPNASTANPFGNLSDAEVAGPPSPLKDWEPVPATVVIKPVLTVTFKTLLLPVSEK